MHISKLKEQNFIFGVPHTLLCHFVIVISFHLRHRCVELNVWFVLTGALWLASCPRSYTSNCRWTVC